MGFALDFALKTHPGLVRPLNEDAIGADPSCGLFALADGLGGYNAGEVAAVMAISAVLERLPSSLNGSRENADRFTPDEVIYDTVGDINTSIYNAALNSAAFEGMATTLVIAWFLGSRLWVAHTGDSRLYRYRGEQLEQLTRDHSFSQELLDAGMVTEEEARILPAKNLVTRALGASPEIEPEIQEVEVEVGDLILLCSDGLTEMVGSYEIAGLLAASSADMHETARRLVDLANEAGGRDNISVVVVKVSGPAAEEPVTAAVEEPVHRETGEPAKAPAEEPSTVLVAEPEA
ncbi:MAG: Stp1/IreP family PP2C-type Ser/Thr phosphatase [Burkholderiaceae bacterium]